MVENAPPFFFGSLGDMIARFIEGFIRGEGGGGGGGGRRRRCRGGGGVVVVVVMRMAA